MRIRYGMITGLLLVLAIAGTEAQDEKELTWEVNIILPMETTLEDLCEMVPGVKIRDHRDGFCRADVSAGQLQMLREAGVRLDIVGGPGRARSLPLESGISDAGLANPLVQEMVNAVSRDTLASHINALQAFGTRYEYTPQRDSAASYILRTLSEYGITAHADWFVFGTTTIYDLEIVSHDSTWIVGTGSMLVATTDAGKTWHSQTSPRSATFYGLNFRDRLVGWAVGSSGAIIHTTDAGATWVPQTSPVNATLYDVGFASEQLGIAVGSGGIVLRTTDGGTSWTQINAGVTAILRKLKIINPLNVWAVGDGGNIIHSSDGGMNWVTQPSGVSRTLYDVDFMDLDIGWAVGDGPSILKTTNGGQLWGQLAPPAGSGTSWGSVSFQNALRGYVVSRSGVVLRTTDGGQSWWTLTNHLNLGWGPSLYAIKAKPDGEIICCGSRGTLTASQNDGATWTSLTANLPPQYVRQSRNVIATIPGRESPEKECIIIAHYDSYSPSASAPGANDNASGTSAVIEAARVCREFAFHSTVTFIAVSAEELGMYGSSDYALRAREQGKQIVGAINGDMIGYPVTGDTARLVIGSYVTRNRLIDSALAYNVRYNIGLTLVPVIDQTGASDYGPFALAGYDALDVAEATAEEIWGGADPYYHKTTDTMDKLSLGLIRRGAQLMLAAVAELAVPEERVSSAPLPSPIPEQLVLHQNFPNPFNPSTTIRYGLPVRSHLTLTVFNTLGQQVAVLQNGEQGAGYHEVRFDGSGLSSGVYFYRIQAGDFVQTRTLLLLH